MSLEKIKSDIQEFGWHSLFVFDPKGENANFHYTVGFEETFNHPELLFFGLSQEAGHGILTDLANDIKLGKSFEPNKKLNGVIGGDFTVIFKSVINPSNTEYLAGVQNYYKKPFRAFVMFWPDKQNILPFEESCEVTLQDEALQIV